MLRLLHIDPPPSKKKKSSQRRIFNVTIKSIVKILPLIDQIKEKRITLPNFFFFRLSREQEALENNRKVDRLVPFRTRASREIGNLSGNERSYLDKFSRMQYTFGWKLELKVASKFSSSLLRCKQREAC